MLDLFHYYKPWCSEPQILNAVGALYKVKMNAHVDALFNRPFFRDLVSVTKPSVGFSWNSVQEFFTEKRLLGKRDFRKTRAVRFTLYLTARHSYSCVAWQTVIEYTGVWRSVTLNCRHTSLSSAYACLPDCPHFFAGLGKIRYWLHVTPFIKSEFHENRCTERKLRSTDSMTFAPCVLRFPPISIKRGTEDVHRSLPSSCKFRENRPREDLLSVGA